MGKRERRKMGLEWSGGEGENVRDGSEEDDDFNLPHVRSQT